ncbi:uncharacterized protein [Amphiura filiformis]|uniref:uncharacterized protein isoform X2 n=1 Tax=Amphiura filiformis TaxID=82378 RepID=UPI003B221287
MPVTAEELVRLLAILAEEENLRVTVKETLKGGAMAGAGAVIGGMCGGPVGLAVGGAVGGACAAYMSRKIQICAEILFEMEPKKRELLYEHFKSIITGIDAHDVTSLGRLIAGDPLIRGQALMGLKDFVGGTMSMQIID